MSRGEGNGVSRFAVLYARPRGTVKQRSYREGTLEVSFRTSYLRATDEEGGECVCSFHSSGLLPNVAYKLMQRAHDGADWVAGAEVHMDGYHIQFVEAYTLHLLPYASATTAHAAANNETVTSVHRDTTARPLHTTTCNVNTRVTGESHLVPTAHTATTTTTTMYDTLSTRLRRAYPHLFA